uniref:RES domain-containing protein n=2 Tax=Pseudomonas TaxID=286 RepID=UPI0013D35F87
DYVPTQVVTEYFRHVYRTDDDHQIDGIIYPSSKTGNKAIVIFADDSGCIDAGDTSSDRTLLRLDRAFDVDLADFAAGEDDDEIF